MPTQTLTPDSWSFTIRIRKRTVQSTLMTVVAAFLASTVIGLAATTISTNIATDGTLSVTGRATTTASLVVGDTQPGPFDLGTGDFYVGAQATTSGNLGLGQGSASDDDSLYFDADSSEWLSWLNTRDLFSLSDDLEVSGNATATTRLVVGTTNPSGAVGAGDLFVGGDATTTGSIYVGDTASTTRLMVSGRATTTGNLVIGSNNQTSNGTTTVMFGSYESTSINQGVCLKFRQGTGFVWCYIGGTGTQLVCSTSSSCEQP